MKTRLKELNDCRDVAEIRKKLKQMNIWKVTFKEDRTEDTTPGGGWCGYLAIDQVRRKASSSKRIETLAEANCIRKTIEELYSCGTGGVRDNWKMITDTAKLSHREVLLSVSDTLKNWSTRLHSGLETARWMNPKNLYGTCRKWN